MRRGSTALRSRPEAAGAPHLAVDQDAGLLLVLAVRESRTLPWTRMRACHWFLRLLLPTPMKRLVRCRLLKRRRGTLARSLFSVAFTCTEPMILAVNLNSPFFSAYLDSLIGQLSAPCTEATRCLRVVKTTRMPVSVIGALVFTMLLWHDESTTCSVARLMAVSFRSRVGHTSVKLSHAPRIRSAGLSPESQTCAQPHLKHHEAVVHLFSGLADELGHRLLVVLLHREVGGDGRVVAPQ